MARRRHDLNQSTVFDPSRFLPPLLAVLCLGVPLLPARAQYDTSQGPGSPLVAMPQIEVRPSEMTPEGRALLKTRSRDAIVQGAGPQTSARRTEADNGRDSAGAAGPAPVGQVRPRTSR